MGKLFTLRDSADPVNKEIPMKLTYRSWHGQGSAPDKVGEGAVQRRGSISAELPAAYATGVLRYRVQWQNDNPEEKQKVNIRIFIETTMKYAKKRQDILKVRTSIPRASKSEPLGATSESKDTKSQPKGSKEGRKGNQNWTKGSQNLAKSEPRGHQNAQQNRCSDQVAKRWPKWAANLWEMAPKMEPFSIPNRWSIRCEKK